MSKAAKSHLPFLLEVGTEEIPSRFIPGILQAMKERVTGLLNDQAVEFHDVTAYATPRRLAIFIPMVSEVQKGRKVQVLGPPKKVAIDSSGNFTAAAAGFARSQNIDVEKLGVVKTERGEYVAASMEMASRKTRDILSETLPAVITSLPMPKAMRWGSSGIRFVRPIQWIAALLGGDRVIFEIDGIKSSGMTRGHRFLSPGAFKIHDPSSYSSILLNNFVVADPAKRKNMILDGMKQIESKLKCVVRRDEDLLEEVVYLVEYPTVVLGGFPEEYLSLPGELLITVMKSHQRFFSVEDGRGALLPHFVLVSNTRPENNDTVKRGAERVLKARLEDARFYFNEDRRKPLHEYIERLKLVTYQDKLGTLYEKSERISSLCSFIAETLGLKEGEKIRRAAILSKADLVTGIVREFPELQGYIGMVYAGVSGEDREVASAIHEHYRPRFSGDTVPASVVGTIVSLADRIDTITSFFLIGLVPSGSEDPYGLRRQALGAIRILQEADFSLPLDILTERAIKEVERYLPPRKTLYSEILRFFYQRLEGVLLNEGYRYDLVNAVLAAGEIPEDTGVTRTSPQGRHDIKDIVHRLKVLTSIKDRAGFPELLTAAKRVYNILAKAKPPAPKEELFREPREKELFSAVAAVNRQVSEKNYTALFELTKPVNDFFESVLVMDKDPEICQNRLALLSTVKGLFDSLGDFSKIVEQAYPADR